MKMKYKHEIAGYQRRVKMHQANDLSRTTLGIKDFNLSDVEIKELNLGNVIGLGVISLGLGIRLKVLCEGLRVVELGVADANGKNEQGHAKANTRNAQILLNIQVRLNHAVTNGSPDRVVDDDSEGRAIRLGQERGIVSRNLLLELGRQQLRPHGSRHSIPQG